MGGFGLLGLAPEPVKRFAGDALKVAREARAVQSGNPIIYAINDLVYPKGLADGTLDAHINQ